VRKEYLIALLVVFLITAVAVGGIFVQRNALKKAQDTEGSLQEQVVEEEASESAGYQSATGEDEGESFDDAQDKEVDLTEYEVSVENGSGIGGEAAYVAEVLEAEGFEEIETGNADRSNYDLTTVKLKEFVEDQVYETIERALNSEYEVTRSAQLLTETFEYDVVVVVGKQI